MIATERGIIGRLKTEYEQFQKYTEMNSNFSFKVTKTIMGTNVPCIYELTYKVRTFTGINEDNTPVYGDVHRFSFDLSNNYPHVKPALFSMTPVWHPNIKYFDPLKGRICFNYEVMGNHTMLHLLLMLNDMLTYENYFAKIGEEPYPEDLEVARWVNEYGDPKGYIDELRRYHDVNRNKVSNTNSSSDSHTVEDRIQMFIQQLFNSNGDAMIVNAEDIEPAFLFKRFQDENNAVQVQQNPELISLISNETDRLKNEGKIWVML